MPHPDTRTGDCPACHKRDPDPGDGRTCGPCQRWMPIALASIPQLVDRAREELIPADDSTSRPVLVCTTCQHTVAYSSRPRHPNPTSDRRHAGWTLRRIVTHTGGPAPSVAIDTIVTGGTTEPPTPLDLHLHDLLAPVVRDGGRPVDVTGDNWIPASRLTPVTVNHTHLQVTHWREEDDEGTVTLHRDHRHITQQLTVMDRRARLDPGGHPVMVPAGDQVGVVSVAQVLDQEVRAWIDGGAPGARFRPTPTVPEMAEWMIRRLHWAYDHYPALDVTLDAVTHVRGQLMSALGEIDPEPEQCDGIACQSCDLRMLFRRNDGTGDIECHNPDCMRVYTAAGYRDWVTRKGGEERDERDPAEVIALLRSRQPQTLRVA